MNQEEKDDLILKYLDFFLEANEKVNLTSINDYNRALVLHVEDSLAGLPEVMDSPDGLYGDLGSGGGFPGVPIAIATGRQAMLVDSVKKKMLAVEGILARLDLSNQITTYGGRIEDLSAVRSGEFAVLTARALSQLPSLVELASPLLSDHGHLICYKGRISEEEVIRAQSLENKLGMKLVSRREFTRSDGETHREIIVFEKIFAPRVKLPRRVGLAQHNPLA